MQLLPSSQTFIFSTGLSLVEKSIADLNESANVIQEVLSPLKDLMTNFGSLTTFSELKLTCGCTVGGFGGYPELLVSFSPLIL